MFSGTAQAVDQENGAVRGRSTLLVDRSGPPRPARYNHIARQNEDPSSSAQSIVAVTSSVVVVPTPAPTATQSSTPQSSTQQPSPAATTLPQVFDSNVGFNFSNTACPNFFTKLQVDPGFQKCYPLSLLLTNSDGFFEAEKSFFATTFVLDAACGVNFANCKDLMNTLAAELTNSEVCGPDLQLQNPLVEQAYGGFLSYPTLFQAGCLKDTQGNYCFANAVTNATSVADAYPYYIPLGTPIPGGVRPSCNGCLKNTMNIFAGAASNQTQPVSKTYVGAAQQVDLSCGPEFVQQSVKTSGAPDRLFQGVTALSGLAVLILVMTL